MTYTKMKVIFVVLSVAILSVVVTMALFPVTANGGIDSNPMDVGSELVENDSLLIPLIINDTHDSEGGEEDDDDSTDSGNTNIARSSLPGVHSGSNASSGEWVDITWDSCWGVCPEDIQNPKWIPTNESGDWKLVDGVWTK
jgi:hypothetical protein